jgi:DNA-binding CsgD family transcriptional regulator/PAS domain-containing protein
VRRNETAISLCVVIRSTLIETIAMTDKEQLSTLISGIYDAALEPAQRSDVLDRIARFTGGHSSGLLVKHSLTNSDSLYCYLGQDEESLQAYSEEYPELEPTESSDPFDAQQVVTTTDLVPYDEFRRGRFYREWAQPQGWVDVASAVIERSATSCAFLSVVRHEASKKAESACFADILDGLSAGMILVDAKGRIVHANAAGTAILDDADFLRAINGRLIASDSAINTAVQDILLAADGGGDDAVGAKGIALPLTAHTGERYVAHVLPLTSGARREAGLAYNAVAALFVRKATLKVYSPAEVIGTMYKLTPTELRVLLAIVDVGGVPEVAAALGVAATTIKTHLGRLFAKTGVARQADLVKLVAGFSTPLAG